MISETQWIEAFVEELKYYMNEKHISQRELSKLSGLAESTISDYIHGLRMPGIRAVNNIAIALGVGVEQLIDFGNMIE